jgi:hypothetical protein
MRCLLLRLGGLSLSLVILTACGNSTHIVGFFADSGPGNTGTPSDGGANESSVSLADANQFSGDTSNDDESDPATCAAAASMHSYVGCDYWPTVVANSIWSIFDFAVVVANTTASIATVTVTGNGATPQTTTIASGQLAKIYLPWNEALKGQDPDNCSYAQPFVTSVTSTAGAYHLVSSVPVTVYQFNAIEYIGQGGPPGKDWSSCPGATACNANMNMPVGCYSFSNDASLLLPSTAMTGNYRLMGIHSLPNSGNYYAVTGTQNGTSVTVTLSSTASVTTGGTIVGTGPGGTVNFMLNAGDVAEIVGNGQNQADDMSGSLLKATQPVQVIGGHPCIAIPLYSTIPGYLYNSCDHVEESIFPAETLGKHYVVTVPTAPGGSPVGHLVRIYGNVDGTSLSYSPAMPTGCPTTIDAGVVVECGIVTSDFEVTGTNEFAVGTFQQSAELVDPADAPPKQQGDPAMSFSAPVEQYQSRYIFLAPSDYEENYADVAVPQGTTLTLDGAPVTIAATPIDGSFSVVRIPLPIGAANGAHVISGDQPFGIQVLGYGSYTAYQYPGGLSLGQIAPPPVK